MSAVTASDLSGFLHAAAAAYGGRVAVAGERGELSFTALERAAGRWAHGFELAGAGPGTHIGLLAGNGPDWLAVAFGVWRAGATLVPISTFVTGRELHETLAHADVRVLVVQPRLRSHDYLERLRQTPWPPRLQQVVVLADTAPAPYRPQAHVLADPPAEPIGLDPESIACILYTSGTTGRPKGVMLSHRAILSTTFPTARRSGLTRTDSLLSTLPLFWVAGLVIRALPTLAAGCALILVETFTADAVVTALRRHRPTAIHFRPAQVGQLLAHPDFTPRLLANVRKGNGRLEWEYPQLGLRETRFITGYGMTEMAGYVTALDWEDPAPVRRTQLGAPLPGVELRIVDPEGGRCAPAQTGEIRVRGPGLFSGYYRHAPGTGLDRDGFFMTGDLGRIEADGTLRFVGRRKELLRVKGINVSPLEVEGVLATHPGVEAAYVVGLPPDGLQQRLVALIVTAAPGPALEAELRALAADALSHYKRPEQYLFLAHGDVPLSGTAKPLRAALAQWAAARLPMPAPMC